MTNKSKNQPNIDSNIKSAAVFVRYYNENIPEAWPQATVKALEKFQASHAGLFKDGNEWNIEKHRKKLMDWLVSYKEEA